MKLGIVGMAVLAGAIMLGGQNVSADEDKPLGPGWFSLDSSVGKLDGAIANGKGSLEKALGIGISGYFDTGWTFSTNHPRNPDSISGRYFDKDQNDLVFNGFNITIDKPEKDWGVGFHIAGDFGRTAELLREATLWGRVVAPVTDAAAFTLKLAHGDRKNNGYGVAAWVDPPQNPLMRKFNLADRKRDVVNLRLDAHHLADAQLGHRAGAILDAHLGARRVVADAVDDDAAETADGPGDDHRLGGAWSGRRL